MNKCPLTGLPCLNDKCIHITDIKDYKAVGGFDLCVLCGATLIEEEQKMNKNKVAEAIFDLLSVLLGGKKVQFMPPQQQQPPQQIPSCPTCGHTINDFITTGKLGCGECYKFFSKELTPLIEKCHGATKHIGKRPTDHKELISKLEADLKEAIKKEEYEMAAEIKKKLDDLK